MWELWGALGHGGRLVVVPFWVSRSPEAFHELLGREQVTVLNQTPSAFQQLVRADRACEPGDPAGSLRALRAVVFGGERLELSSLAPWWERHGEERPRLVNMYGITETTVHVTYRRLRAADATAGNIGSRIGRPIGGLDLYLLDASLEPVALGTPGEIVVGGSGVSMGYLGRPELTAERFVPDGFGGLPGARLYRSGDLARHRPDGDLEVLGRIDRQVKVRGFRIELGEVEAALRRLPEVRDAAVWVQGERPEDRGLVACVVPAADVASLDLVALRSSLAASLPAYLVPSRLVALPALPLTANGKLDRVALASAAESETGIESAAWAPPETGLEVFLAELFGEALGQSLGRRRIGLDDDFFALGGNSIAGAVLINRLQEELGEIVHVVAIFNAPSVRRLAAHLAVEHAAAVARLWPDSAEAPAGAPARSGRRRIVEEDVAAFRRLIRPPAPATREAKNPPVLFVLSPPRSGSTLLRVLLGGHSRLFAPPELELLSFATLADRAAAFAGRDRRFWLEGVVRAVMEVRGCSSQEAAAIVAEAEGAGRSTGWLYGRMQEWIAPRTLVDKTPSYALDRAVLARAEEWFERPLYIHLLRHPYGMIRSFEEARLDQIFFRHDHGFGRRQLAELIWRVSEENILSTLAGVPAERQLRVSFEALVASPETVLAGVCSFLGIPYEPAMAEAYDGRRERMTDGIHAESRMLGDVKFQRHRRVERGTAERWRSELGEDFLAAGTWRLAESLGYARGELGSLARREAPGEPLPEPAPPIRPAARNAPLPLSFAQERLWLVDQLAHEELSYAVPVAVRLRGALRPAALAATLAEIARRHETLRTRFVARGGRPFQEIDAGARMELPEVDLAGLPAGAGKRELQRLLAAEQGPPFDLTRGGLVRATLVRTAADDRVLLFTMHHIISDGWSLGVLLREVAAIYPALASGRPSPLPELAIQYADFAAWQRGWLTGRVLDEQLSYWTRQLAGLALLDLPTDRPQYPDRLPDRRAVRAALLSAEVPAALAEAIRALARREGVTLFMALLAVFQTLLHRLAGQGDLAVGTPVANRNRREIEPLIGFFVNTLVLRSRWEGAPSFRRQLAAVRETTLAAYDHQDLPFTLVVEALHPARRGESMPLVDAMFTLRNPSLGDIRIPGLELLPLSRAEGADLTAQSILVMSCWDSGGRLGDSLSYDADRIERTTAARWQSQWLSLLAAVAGEPERPLRELPLLTESERHQLLVEWGSDGEVVLEGGLPTAIGVWGELCRRGAGGAAEPTGRRGRRLADGRLALALPAATAADAATAAMSPAGPAGPTPSPAPAAEPTGLSRARSDLDHKVEGLSQARRDLLAKRLGQAVARAAAPKREDGGGAAAAAAERTQLKRRAERSGEIPRLPRPLPPLRLSFAQERLWFVDRLTPGGVVYNVPAAMLLRGRLAIPVLAASLEAIVRRHDTLRTRFTAGPDGPLQVVAEPAPLPLPLVDLGALPPARRQAELRALAAAEAATPFDLERGPMLRATLVALAAPEGPGEGDAEHALLHTMHHIASDGWSASVLVDDLVQLYAAFLAGRRSPLAELPIQYGDFAVWQRARLAGEALAGELRHWREAIDDAPPVLDLPTDHPRPPLQSTRGGGRSFTLPAAAAARVRELARTSGGTVFMVGLAAFSALLHRLTGQRSLLVGSMIANRKRAELEDLIGFFVNTLVLRSDLAAGESFGDLLARARERALDAYAHQDLPFEKIVEAVLPARDPSRPPLVQVVFQLFNDRPPARQVPGLSVTSLGAAAESAKFDLAVNLAERGETLVGRCVYNSDLFDGTTIERLAAGFVRLLAAAAAAPETAVAELPLLGAGELHQVLFEWSAGGEEPARGATIAALFAGQAGRRPDAVALEGTGGVWTYGALAARAGAMARVLRGAGVGPDVVVGICLPRSAELVLSALAVVLAGGAYLPLDAELPTERLAFMAGDAGMAAVLTEEASLGRLAAIRPAGHLPVFTLEALAREKADPAAAPADLDADHLAYVMYTSGSTGRPKGVAITQRGVVRLVAGVLDFGPGQVTLAMAPFSFDASTAEIWGALDNGSRLVVPPPGIFSPDEIAELVARHGASVLWLTAGLFHQVVEQAIARGDGARRFASVARLLAGGDVLAPALTARAVAALPGTLVVAAYGPTESTTLVSIGPLASPGDIGATVSLGRPIAGTRLAVLGAEGGPPPVGAAGELLAGGAGLARGYVGRPELTAAVFVPDPQSGALGTPGARLYRTGDLARHLADGRLEFLGRADRQVKLRGFRVEPGEVEEALAACPGVRQAAVLARRERGDLRLAAYVAVGAEGGRPAPGPAELRAQLRRRLPEVMVPAHISILAALPLTANGKLDRAALAARPRASDAAAGQLDAAPRTPPRNPTEELLAAIWSEVLGVERIGVEDNFFALSGHSLLATQVAFRVREAFGIELPLVRLFERATLGELAAEIAAAAESEAGLPPAEPIAPAPPGAAIPAAFLQEWAIELQGGPVSAAMNMPFAIRLDGPLDVAALRSAVAEIRRRHAVLRTTFRREGGELLQVVDEGAPPTVPVADLASLPEARREALLRALVKEDARRPFDVFRGPLLTVRLLRLGAEAHAVLFNMHHAISDGWSMEIFQSELAALYGAFRRGEPSPLPPLALQFGDFAHWQRRSFAGPVLAAQLAHWHGLLADRPPVVDLPADRPRPEVLGSATVRGGFALGGPPLAALRAAARAAGCTVSMVLLAALQALIHRYTGEEDVLVGSIVSGRHRREFAPLVGMFMNSVTVRTDLSGGPSFTQLMQRTRAAALDAYRHQDVPFPALLAALFPGRALHRTLMFRAAFNMHSFSSDIRPAEAAAGLGLPGLRARPLGEVEVPAKYDLLVTARDEPDHLRCGLTGAADLFDAETLDAICRDYEALLVQIAADPNARLDQLLPEPHHRLVAGVRGQPR